MSARFPCCGHCADPSDVVELFDPTGRGHGLYIPLNGHSVPCAADWCDEGKRPIPAPQLGDAA